MKTYCTQNNGDCKTCSLVNYGRDCHNNPINKTQKTKKLRGRAAAMDAYNGHNGPVTLAAVEDQIPDELRQRLTGREYGLVMSVVNTAYHNGRASHGGLDLCDDCVWLPWGGGTTKDNTTRDRGQLIPIAALRTIEVEATPKSRRYTMDYIE